MESRVQDKAKRTTRETTEHTDYRGAATYDKGSGYMVDPAEAPATKNNLQVIMNTLVLLVVEEQKVNVLIVLNAMLV